MLLFAFIDMESGIHILLFWHGIFGIYFVIVIVIVLQFVNYSALATDFESLRCLFANSICYLLLMLICYFTQKIWKSFAQMGSDKICISGLTGIKLIGFVLIFTVILPVKARQF